MINRAFKAIRRADVVLLVLDMTQGVYEQDATLAERIADEGRACIIVGNKWDAVEGKDDRAYRAALQKVGAAHSGSGERGRRTTRTPRAHCGAQRGADGGHSVAAAAQHAAGKERQGVLCHAGEHSPADVRNVRERSEALRRHVPPVYREAVSRGVRVSRHSTAVPVARAAHPMRRRETLLHEGGGQTAHVLRCGLAYRVHGHHALAGGQRRVAALSYRVEQSLDGQRGRVERLRWPPQKERAASTGGGRFPPVTGGGAQVLQVRLQRLRGVWRGDVVALRSPPLRGQRGTRVHRTGIVFHGRRCPTHSQFLQRVGHLLVTLPRPIHAAADQQTAVAGGDVGVLGRAGDVPAFPSAR
eukprot:ctg_1134.g468